MTGPAPAVAILPPPPGYGFLEDDPFGAPTYVRAPMRPGRTLGLPSREYYAPLASLLNASRPDSERAVDRWLGAVLAHLAADVTIAPNMDPAAEPLVEESVHDEASP